MVTTYKIESLSTLTNSLNKTKTFDLAFCADSGAMGCAGLVIILCQDTLYLGNTFNCDDPIYESNLIKILEHFPQLISLIGYGNKIQKRNETSNLDLNFSYIGMGNSVLIERQFGIINKLINPSFPELFNFLYSHLDNKINILNQSHLLK